MILALCTLLLWVSTDSAPHGGPYDCVSRLEPILKHLRHGDFGNYGVDVEIRASQTMHFTLRSFLLERCLKGRGTIAWAKYGYLKKIRILDKMQPDEEPLFKVNNDYGVNLDMHQISQYVAGEVGYGNDDISDSSSGDSAEEDFNVAVRERQLDEMVRIVEFPHARIMGYADTQLMKHARVRNRIRYGLIRLHPVGTVSDRTDIDFEGLRSVYRRKPVGQSRREMVFSLPANDFPFDRQRDVRIGLFIGDPFLDHFSSTGAVMYHPQITTEPPVGMLENSFSAESKFQKLQEIITNAVSSVISMTAIHAGEVKIRDIILVDGLEQMDDWNVAPTNTELIGFMDSDTGKMYLSAPHILTDESSAIMTVAHEYVHAVIKSLGGDKFVNEYDKHFETSDQQYSYRRGAENSKVNLHTLGADPDDIKISPTLYGTFNGDENICEILSCMLTDEGRAYLHMMEHTHPVHRCSIKRRREYLMNRLYENPATKFLHRDLQHAYDSFSTAVPRPQGAKTQRLVDDKFARVGGYETLDGEVAKAHVIIQFDTSQASTKKAATLAMDSSSWTSHLNWLRYQPRNFVSSEVQSQQFASILGRDTDLDLLGPVIFTLVGDVDINYRISSLSSTDVANLLLTNFASPTKKTDISIGTLPTKGVVSFDTVSPVMDDAANPTRVVFLKYLQANIANERHDLRLLTYSPISPFDYGCYIM